MHADQCDSIVRSPAGQLNSGEHLPSVLQTSTCCYVRDHTLQLCPQPLLWLVGEQEYKLQLEIYTFLVHLCGQCCCMWRQLSQVVVSYG